MYSRRGQHYTQQMYRRILTPLTEPEVVFISFWLTSLQCSLELLNQTMNSRARSNACGGRVDINGNRINSPFTPQNTCTRTWTAYIQPLSTRAPAF